MARESGTARARKRERNGERESEGARARRREGARSRGSERGSERASERASEGASERTRERARAQGGESTKVFGREAARRRAQPLQISSGDLESKLRALAPNSVNCAWIGGACRVLGRRVGVREVAGDEEEPWL
eukprot:183664-Pleurochrysis_carterae.AAC.1